MKILFRVLTALLLLPLFLPPESAPAQSADVIIYGGTSSSVIAAAQVKRMGKSVILVSPDRHLGGLTSGGLGFTDSGNTSTVGGLAREFYRRIYREYEKPEAWTRQKREDFGNVGQGTKAMLHDDRSMWVFEPHVAQSVFDRWVAKEEIPVVRGALLDRENGVTMDGNVIRGITTLDGKTFTGKMFIDATYEGDLMAAAGVSYHVGREDNAVYGERWNGNQMGVFQHPHWFQKPISPYVDPDDPSSGLLPWIDDSSPGVNGEGDRRIQANCFRLCMTNDPDNRIPFIKPPGYDPANYELMNRVYASGWREMFDKYDAVPNRKTDTNNHGPFSSDFIGQNHDYPEASYSRRAEILAAHYDYQMGLLYYQANDPNVPAEIREKMSEWVLAADEFTDNGHWPRQIYVREARRMIGQYVMTEHDCLRTVPDPLPAVFARMRKYGPVAMGSYSLDAHNVRRLVTEEGHVQNEGDVGVPPKAPYPIDYGAIIPRPEECGNLLVPVCVSSSHIAFGSIRMEPVFMMLGQSAATAAALSIDQNCAVQDLPYPDLARRLQEDGQRLD